MTTLTRTMVLHLVTTWFQGSSDINDVRFRLYFFNFRTTTIAKWGLARDNLKPKYFWSGWCETSALRSLNRACEPGFPCLVTGISYFRKNQNSLSLIASPRGQKQSKSYVYHLSHSLQFNWLFLSSGPRYQAEFRRIENSLRQAMRDFPAKTFPKERII